MAALLDLIRRWGTLGAVDNVRADLLRTEVEEQAATMVASRVRFADERRAAASEAAGPRAGRRPVAARAA